MREITRHVEAMRPMSKGEKKTYLQRLIGPSTKSAHELHFRALLMTALNEAKVWPHGQSE